MNLTTLLRYGFLRYGFLHYGFLHYGFLGGLVLLTLLVWRWRRSSAALFVVAALVWLMGMAAVYTAFQARGPVWLASTVRRFHFELRARPDAPLGKHHEIVYPALTERLPIAFDRLTTAVEMEVTFQLETDGRVRSVQIARSAGIPALDDATVSAVRAWRFGPLPPSYPAPAAEVVRLNISNQYRVPAQSTALLIFALAFLLFWALAVLGTPSDRVLAGTLPTEARGSARKLVIVAGFLAGLGWLMVYRLSPDLKLFQLPAKQAEWIFFSLLAFGVGALAARYWQGIGTFISRIGWGWVALGVGLLLVTRFTPLGTDNNTGAKLWLRIPFGLGPFQTIELVKLLMVFYVAGVAYEKNRPGKRAGAMGRMARLRLTSVTERFRGLAGAFVLVFMALIVMSDFGPLLLLFLLLLAMICAQGHRKLSGQGLALLLILLSGSYLVGVPTRWHDRVEIWRHPWQATATDSRGLQEGREHASRALWAVSSGGLTGSGLGQGRPDDIEAVISDFMFAALAEELGWIGGAALLGLLAFLVVASLRLAESRDDAFEKMLIAGLGLLVGAQSALILGGNLSLWPLTGITLPFLSYGGSSLLVNFLALGLLAGAVGRKTTISKALAGNQNRQANLSLHSLRRGFAVLFVVFAAWLSWLQSPWPHWLATTQRHHRADGSALSNPRVGAYGQIVPSHTVRGRILDRTGQMLAETTPRGRVYPRANESVSIVGFETPEHQRVGLERFLDGPLMGLWRGPTPNFSPAHPVVENRGYDLTLTLDARLQSLAYKLLEDSGYTGCIVGIAPQTGEVLFAVSRSASGNSARTVQAWQNAYDNRPGTSPVCYRRLYAPGSTFKTVMAAAALDKGVLSPADRLVCRGVYTPPNHGQPIHDFEYRRDRGFPGHGERTLAEALTHSCNVIYAEVGTRVGWQRLYDFADGAGFHRYLPLIPELLRGEQQVWFETPQSVVTPGASPVSALSRQERQPIFLAQTALGQRNVRMTPLHLALWAAAIANQGRLMEPSVLLRCTDAGGGTLWSHEPRVLSQALSPQTARQLTAMMEQVVERGTGNKAQVLGLRIAGKTGSPEEDSGISNAMFIAFAPIENPRVAIAVVIEGGKTGGSTAAPLAAKLLQATCQ